MALIQDGVQLAAGTYRVVFDVGAYHERQGVQGFYPEVGVTFVIRDATQHYHVPLLISPFGFSTYRGS
jgi:5-hydroxyisourate hydrolase